MTERAGFFAKYYLFVILIMPFISINLVSAHHEGSISGPGIAGPIITLPARTLPKGRAFLSSGLKYTNFENFSRGQVASLNARRQTSGQIDNSLQVNIGAGYGITDDWDIYMSIPYQFKYNLIETDGGQRTDFGDSIGLGDITLLSQYRFLKLPHKGLYASLVGGLSIPTGESGKETDQGVKFGNDDQPGTGSWDPIFGASLSKDLGPFSFDTNFLYRLSNEGPRDAVVGDNVNYNVALSYRVPRKNLGQEHSHNHADSGTVIYHKHAHASDSQHHTMKHSNTRIGDFLAGVFPQRVLGQDLSWDLISEVNYQWNERPEINDVEERNHGGHLILATEGIRAIVNERYVTNLAVQLPLIEGFNGAQPDPAASVIFNFSVLF